MRIEINKYLVADSEICHGKPTFSGTRIMVWQVLEMLESGKSIKEVIAEFSQLTEIHVKVALGYAASLTRGRDNVTVSIPLEA